tara:strand:+ start:779 stop:2068 length:1290 start_codon:yes stop_codon:yes gene_type:complete
MLFGILISFFILTVFVVGIWKFAFFKINGIPKYVIHTTLIAKVLAGLFFWWIYTHYYTDRSSADLYKYFDDAQALMVHSEGNNELRLQLFLPENERSADYQNLIEKSLHWDRGNETYLNDNRTIIRIHFLILYLSNGFFLLHNLIFCLFAFLGGIALLHFFMRFTTLPKLLLFGFVFFLPSMLLFSSAALKESWLLFCLGFFLFFLGKAMQEKKLSHWSLSILFALLMIGVKPYILIALIPGILLFILNYNYPKKIASTFLGIHAIILVATLLAFPDFITILSEKQAEFIQLAVENNANSYFPIQEFETTKEAFFALPEAMYNVWIRPIFSFFENPFAMLAAIENLVLLLMLPLSIIYFRKPTKQALPLVLSALSFVIILSCLIGLCVPVIGAIVRYKMPIYPFFIVVLFSFIDFNRLPLIRQINQKKL